MDHEIQPDPDSDLPKNSVERTIKIIGWSRETMEKVQEAMARAAQIVIRDQFVIIQRNLKEAQERLEAEILRRRAKRREMEMGFPGKPPKTNFLKGAMKKKRKEIRRIMRGGRR